MIQYHEINTSEWASNGKMLPNTEVLLPRIDGSTISVGRCSGMEPHIVLNDEDLIFIAYVLRIDGNDKALSICLVQTDNEWIVVDKIASDDIIFRIRVAVREYERMMFYPGDGFGYSDGRYYTLEALT